MLLVDGAEERFLVVPGNANCDVWLVFADLAAFLLAAETLHHRVHDELDVYPCFPD
jgi:hypothetical protein